MFTILWYIFIIRSFKSCNYSLLENFVMLWFSFKRSRIHHSWFEIHFPTWKHLFDLYKCLPCSEYIKFSVVDCMPEGIGNPVTEDRGIHTNWQSLILQVWWIQHSENDGYTILKITVFFITLLRFSLSFVHANWDENWCNWI